MWYHLSFLLSCASFIQFNTVSNSCNTLQVRNYPKKCSHCKQTKPNKGSAQAVVNDLHIKRRIMAVYSQLISFSVPGRWCYTRIRKTFIIGNKWLKLYWNYFCPCQTKLNLVSPDQPVHNGKEPLCWLSLSPRLCCQTSRPSVVSPDAAPWEKGSDREEAELCWSSPSLRRSAFPWSTAAWWPVGKAGNLIHNTFTSVSANINRCKQQVLETLKNRMVSCPSTLLKIYLFVAILGIGISALVKAAVAEAA